jgi:hypothetical protein
MLFFLHKLFIINDPEKPINFVGPRWKPIGRAVLGKLLINV